MLEVIDVPQAELPEGADAGFRIKDEDAVVMFFHWHNEVKVIHTPAQLTRAQIKGVEYGGGEDVWASEPGHEMRTGYSDVLMALEQRLQEMDYHDEVAAILGEVVGRYGAGE